jgi:glyoxylase-like metal-dependent hydrolase (beta-lactamase superfamily II)
MAAYAARRTGTTRPGRKAVAIIDPGAAPEPGPAVALSRIVRRVTAPNPGMMTGPGTNTYLVGTTELVVVDPGPDPALDDGGHIAAVDELGHGRIGWIVVTHTHVDHSPGAAALAQRTGAEVIGFDGRDGFVPDRSVGDGFVLSGPGFTLRAVHTPGHASNHLCWLLEEEAWIFSGDHVMEGSTVVISPPDGDMTLYLASLDTLRTLSPALKAIAPGHGSLITHPRATLDAITVHRLEREGKVASALRSAGTATVDDLLASVYADVDEARHQVARRSLWAHLRKLGTEGRARGEDPDDIDASWQSVG